MTPLTLPCCYTDGEGDTLTFSGGLDKKERVEVVVECCREELVVWLDKESLDDLRTHIDRLLEGM